MLCMLSQPGVLGILFILLAAPRAPGWALPAKPASPPPAPQIQILSDVPLPPELNEAADVRWAGDDSVFLALRRGGVAELSLKPPGRIEEVFPGASKVGGLRFAFLVAASSPYVVTSSVLSLAWRHRSAPSYVEAAFEIAKAVDVKDDQLLVIGLRRDADGEVGADGAIAWRGPLQGELTALTPILYDVTGPGVRSVNSCSTMRISAARFLPDGKFILAPGVQPGIHLYDANNKLLRVWDTGTLGIDTDCASLPQEQAVHIAAHYPESLAWINRRRVIDTLLPLANGAALVVRSVVQGRARWEVKILSEEGAVRSLPLPLEVGSDLFHLSGDARDGKILLLLYERRLLGEKYSPPRLIRIQLPQ